MENRPAKCALCLAEVRSEITATVEVDDDGKRVMRIYHKECAPEESPQDG